MIKLMPCPFCGNELGRKTGQINPMARCITEGCIVAEKMSVINLDDPVSVERWNTRAEPAAAPVTEQEDARSRFFADRVDTEQKTASNPSSSSTVPGKGPGLVQL